MHLELHITGRMGWLSAAVLGANDGIVSTASLVPGIAVAGPHLQVFYRRGLHAAAALAHHYVWRDNTLQRMMPGKFQD